MKILVTGFDPFGGEKVNPAYEAVKLLPDEIAGAKIIKLEIPTVFSKSGPAVEAGIQVHNPDVVLNIGQAGGRACVTIERVGINLAEARIPDNAGEQPMDQPLQPDGPSAYFATIPVKAMVKNVRDHGILHGGHLCVQLRHVQCIAYGRHKVSQYPGGLYPCPLRQRAGGGEARQHPHSLPGNHRKGAGVRN